MLNILTTKELTEALIERQKFVARERARGLIYYSNFDKKKHSLRHFIEETPVAYIFH